MVALTTIFMSLSLSIGLYYLILFIIKRRRIIYYVDQIPGPSCLPIIGNTWQIMGKPDVLWVTLRKLCKDYYPIYRLWFTKYAVVNLCSPDDAEVLLKCQENITKSPIYDFFHPWLATGIFTSTGSKWRMRRKMLTPSFHFNLLREFSGTFEKEGRRMVKELNSYNGEVTLEIIPFAAKYTLNAICETSLGTSLTKLEIEDNKFFQRYINAIHELQKIVILRIQNPWYHSNFLFSLSKWNRIQNKDLDIVIGFSKKIIAERKKFHEDTKGVYLEGIQDNCNANENGSNRTIFKTSNKKLATLDLLISNLKDGSIDDDGIREESDIIMFAGHDTTAAGIAFTLLLFAEHQDIQQRAREEVDKILKTSNGRFTITELQQLNYLERCIKESLRLYPPAPFIARQFTKDLQLKNYLLPEGTVVHLHIFDVHRDPNFWPDPTRFDPDRFLPENIQKQHPFAYIPFAAGLRNCPGQKYAIMQLKAMVGHVIHNFNLEPIDIVSDAELLQGIVITPKHPLRVKFVPRKLI